jgi:hypothetical protein
MLHGVFADTLLSIVVSGPWPEAAWLRAPNLLGCRELDVLGTPAPSSWVAVPALRLYFVEEGWTSPP